MTRKIAARLAAMAFLALGSAPAFAAGAPAPAGPKLETGHYINPKEGALKDPKPLPFEPSDFIRLAADPVRSKFALGEPVILNLRLVNHTQFTIGVITNFNPRANLEIMIAPEKERPRRSFGPFASGSYPTDQVLLYPLEEFPVQLMLWGDLETPNGLVFPAPGRYEVQILLDVSATNSTAKGKIPPLNSANLKPISFRFEIAPTPPEWAPLVEKLSAAKAYPLLHTRNAPEALYADLPELIKQYPATPISPYLTYALGLRYNLEAKATPDDKELPYKASALIQQTALADSYFKSEAWETVMNIADRQGLGEQAYQACLEMFKILPPAIAVRKGTSDSAKKYLKNSAEMSPLKYWDLLE